MLLVLAIVTVVWSHGQAGEAYRPTSGHAKGVLAHAAAKPSAASVDSPSPKPSSSVGLHCADIEVPAVASSAKDSVVRNVVGRYTLLYSESRLQSRWVAYKLIRSDVGGGAGRSSSFTVDPYIAGRGWRYATNADYAGSGYDKGHLLPSADRSASKEQNRETFRLSNIAPQRPRLNRGPWRLLEEELRRRTARYDTLYIVTGPIFAASAAHIGRGGVDLPDRFYKAVVMRRGQEFSSVAYVMPNTDEISSDYRQYIVTVDSVERLAGIDLFPKLPDSVFVNLGD